VEGVKPSAIVDIRGTWKPYMVAYKIIKGMTNLDQGAIVEVITKDNKGILNDINTWCRATGHALIGTEKRGEEILSSYVQKGEPKKDDRRMTVVISTASLLHVLFPFDKALAGAVLGMDVNVLFEGAGVRLLKRGYRSKLPGKIGGMFTGMVEKTMKREIGQPLPSESIGILEEFGAHFYICGPSMFGYKVQEEELTVRNYTVAAVVTWADLLANSDVNVFSRAQFERP
jgi:TusA-related sulfurtransferase/predicted peroxiredoxin